MKLSFFNTAGFDCAESSESVICPYHLVGLGLKGAEEKHCVVVKPEPSLSVSQDQSCARQQSRHPSYDQAGHTHSQPTAIVVEKIILFQGAEF